MIIILLAVIILLALDVVFREGELVFFLLSQDIYLSFFVKVVCVIIAFIATLLLLHAVIWDFNILPRMKRKKTEYEIEKEMEAENTRMVEEREEREIEELERLEREKEEQEKDVNEKERLKNEMAEATIAAPKIKKNALPKI